MDKKIFQQAGFSQAISVEDQPEEYILTKEEEEECLRYAIQSEQNYIRWKAKERPELLNEDIEAHLKKIDWDKKINKEVLFKTANSNKHRAVWQKQQRVKDAELEVQKYEELKSIWTADNIYKLMSATSKNEFGKQLIVNSDNINMIKAICFFISADIRFETELGYSFKKGLLFRGVSGVGKTYNLKCISDNGINPVLILSMVEITDQIRDSGEYNINMSNRKIIYLDDVGTEEPTIKFFGTNISFFKNFIETVYLRNTVFNKLIISTNNSFKELEDKYGFRVRSRIREMFNIIDVAGNDMRV